MRCLAHPPDACITLPSARHSCCAQIASYLNRLTSDLEAAAYPALDSLTSRVTSHNLERVRRIKSRLVRLTTRVENVSVPGTAAGVLVAAVAALPQAAAVARWQRSAAPVTSRAHGHTPLVSPVAHPAGA
jgi:hypothetical protein